MLNRILYRITTINNAVLEGKKALYPVGSLYFNATSNVNPSTLLGFGTLERIAQGKTLIGVDTEDTDFSIVGKTGGSKTKTLGLEHMPQNLYVDGQTKRVPLGDVAGKLKMVDPKSQMIKEAKRIGISFGD